MLIKITMHINTQLYIHVTGNLTCTVKVSYHMISLDEWQNDSSKRHKSQAPRPPGSVRALKKETKIL